jgi:hypothetical protein
MGGGGIFNTISPYSRLLEAIYLDWGKRERGDSFWENEKKQNDICEGRKKSSAGKICNDPLKFLLLE